MFCNSFQRKGEHLCQWNYLTKNTMGNLLYIIAVVLVIAWAIGFFAYSAGSIIHILLIIALIAILLKIIQGRNPFRS